MIIAFTGHRLVKLGGYDIPNPIYDYVRNETKKLLLELKPDKAISGMAIGFDQWCAELCVELEIPFIAAVPFIGQERIWKQSVQDHYNYLLSKAVEIKIVSEGGYAAWKMQTRNCWMSDNCDLLIGCWDGSNGGTANCLRYAEGINREIRKINPNG